MEYVNRLIEMGVALNRVMLKVPSNMIDDKKSVFIQ